MSKQLPTIEEQIACVIQELRRRQEAYPEYVRLGHMTSQQAIVETERMEEVLLTLQAIRDGDHG